MINTLFKDFFDKWMSVSPTGQPFVRAPWDPEYSWDGELLKANYHAYIPPIGKALLAISILTILSFIVKSALLAGMGAALVTLCILAYRDSWLQSGAITLTGPDSKITVSEHQKFKISLKATNNNPFTGNSSFLIIGIGDVQPQTYIIPIKALSPFESFSVEVSFTASLGMGSYKIDTSHLITQDYLGLISRCVEHKMDISIEVLPEYMEVSPLEIFVAGLTAHSGSVETNSSGDSVNYLGSRHFRNGDSIRRIDWKKSERSGSLIVREFEKLNSTDATIIFDTRSLGIFQYKNLNTFELAKDSLIALSRSLMSQRLRVKLATESFVSDFGKGQNFLDYIIEVTKELRPDNHSSYEQTLERYREIIPPYSVVIPLFFSVNIDLESFLETVYLWSLQQIQIQPIIIDINQFDKGFNEGEQLSTIDQSYLSNLRGMYLNSVGSGSYSSIARKISEKTILIGPGESLGQAIIRQQQR
jgi:uncharacterized protein (DUF58 family)